MVGQFFEQLSFVDIFNICAFILFTFFYVYQVIYLLVALSKKPKRLAAKTNHRYAVMISARNEENVIANLIQSLQAQDYPQELIDIYVVADNCTDDTALVAQNGGATVFVRNDDKHVGKGYGLDYCYSSIHSLYPTRAYDAYFVFDADNVLDVNYFREMNATYDNGALVSTSYRNSKNYDTNWISAGYAIWFLREAKFSNEARLLLNTSCTISGTGFYIAASILEKHGGWKWHLITEDMEFSAQAIIDEIHISYTPTAVFYDEQPTSFVDSWNQRFRWAKGFYQVLANYGARLISHSFTNSRGSRFACYDLLMTIAPGMLMTVVSGGFNATILILALIGWLPPNIAVASSAISLGFCFLSYMLFMFIFGLITTITEWHKIRGSRSKKLRYMFTFPIFMLIYIPIALVALVKKAEWKQIKHVVSVNIEDYLELREIKKQGVKPKVQP